MKKLLFTLILINTMVTVRGQMILCDSLTIFGSQFQATISVNTSSLPVLVDYWVTTAPDGTVLAEDSMSAIHNVYNFTNPSTGLTYDTIVTCLFTMNSTCCVTYVWNGNAWTAPGGPPTPSWDCPINSPGGCYDPGTGNGQYSSLAACQTVCGAPPLSWDCDPVSGCYDPGTGLGQYTSLAACQAVCVSTSSSLCDSMTVFSTGGSPQTILTAEVPNINTIIDYWITTAPDGTILGEDSMWNTHQIFNTNPTNGQPFDTINVCITYPNLGAYFTCCVTWIWDGTSWNKIGSITNIGEINDVKNRLVKVVDVLGRETSININQTVFFIYEDGTIEKRYIIDRK